MSAAGSDRGGWRKSGEALGPRFRIAPPEGADVAGAAWRPQPRLKKPDPPAV
jgi:hypothetical protein